MIRKSLAAAAMFAAVQILATGAAAEQVRFRGSFTLISVKNCIARYLGETFNSTFRPAGVGDNPDVTSLTQLNQFSGDVYELPGGAFPLNTWVTVKAWGFDNLHYRFRARIKITSQEPAVIDETTEFVSLTGLIRKMGNDPGLDGTCVAGFRGSYFRRVE